MLGAPKLSGQALEIRVRRTGRPQSPSGRQQEVWRSDGDAVVAAGLGRSALRMPELLHPALTLLLLGRDEQRWGRAVAAGDSPQSGSPDYKPEARRRLYRREQCNPCPECGNSQWHVGRASAECAFCATALPLAPLRGGPPRRPQPA